MGLPEKGYFALDELVRRWGTDLGNLKYYAEQDWLEIHVWLSRQLVKVYEPEKTSDNKVRWNEVEPKSYKGYVILHPDEVRKVFRFQECPINKFTSLDKKQSYRISDGRIKYKINVTDKIELHFNVENCVIHQKSTSMERLMWNMSVMMAQSYVDSLRDNVNRAKGQKLKCGECIGLAPVGYLNFRDERGRADVKIDEARGPLVAQLFETYSTGAHTLAEMVEISRDWGLTNPKRLKKALNKAQVYRILTNKFYYGVMSIKKNGEEHPHRYAPLITKALFDQCQEVRLNWGKKPFKYSGKEYLFRGILTCATTGKTMSSDTKIRNKPDGSKHVWTYLGCWNPDNSGKKIWIREEDIISQVETALEKLTIKDQQTLHEISSIIYKTNESKKECHKKQTAAFKKEHTVIEDKLDQLLDLVMDKTITREEFETKKRKLKDRQREITELVSDYDEADDEFSKRLIDLLNMASGALQRFHSSNIVEKREILNFVFSNLKMKGKKLEYSMRCPFDTFTNIGENSKWSERRDSNSRPSGPKPDALPDCATLRLLGWGNYSICF